MEADAQCSLAVSLGIPEPDRPDVTLVNILKKVINDDDVDPGEGIIRHEERIDFIPTNIEQHASDMEKLEEMEKKEREPEGIQPGQTPCRQMAGRGADCAAGAAAQCTAGAAVHGDGERREQPVQISLSDLTVNVKAEEAEGA